MTRLATDVAGADVFSVVCNPVFGCGDEWVAAELSGAVALDRGVTVETGFAVKASTVVLGAVMLS